ncbi:MAG: hypothetical protein M1837_004498 [Sclerophora amabilis]|nr:MAG: hypothetical protein M1837_004498 [Sclerophora amabilis]
MPRLLKFAAAQVGPVHRDSERASTLLRMIDLLEDAASQGAKIVTFPECTFTTFFPRHLINDIAELDQYFEHGEDIRASANIKPLFDSAHKLGVDISVGFAERTASGQGFNTAVYFSARAGEIISKYRKVHLPGTKEPFDKPDAVNQLEKRYFEPGNLGFEAFRAPDILSDCLKAGTKVVSTAGKGDAIFGTLICNDRRWPEAWRCLGLQGVELVMCGYNTPSWAPDLWGMRKEMSREEAEAEVLFHHKLVMQSNSYMNSCFSISAARVGPDDGTFDMIGGSMIVSPEGHIIAEAKGKDDELVMAEIDLEECYPGKAKVGFFEFEDSEVEADFGFARLSISVGIEGQRHMDASSSKRVL